MNRRRGSVLVVTVIVVVAVAGLVALLFSLTLVLGKASGASTDAARALNLAEAAVSHSMEDLRTGGAGTVRGRVGNGSFAASASRTDDGFWLIRAVGQYGTVRRGIEAVVGPAGQDPFVWGVFGEASVRLDSNAQVAGNVGSNGSIRLDSNARILGDAYGSEVRMDSHASVAGRVDTLADPFYLPPVQLPAGFESFPGVSPSGSLGPGSYRIGSLRLRSNRTLTLYGPMTIVVDEVDLDSNSRIDIASGPVTIYARNKFRLDSNATMNNLNRRPSDLRIMVGVDNRGDADPNERVKIDSNSRLYGVVYAPRARVRLDSNSEIFGAVVGWQVELDSNMRVHYDETLAGLLQENGALAILSWREVAR